MAAEDLEQLVLSISADTRQIQRALKRLEGDTGASTKKIERQFDGLGKRLNGAFAGIGRAAKGLLAGVAAAFTLREAQGLIDASTRIQNALKVAGLEGAELTRVYDRLFDSAQRNAAPLESLVTLYGRAAIVQKELGVSTEELLGFTDNVALALRVAGTDAQSASGALLQLSQALGSGTVRAEEFNSILEGALPIAQAAAAGLEEAGGSVSKLRALIVDGKVSSEAFFRAFEAGSVILKDKVAGSVLTTDQATTKLWNALTKAAGEFNAATGASENFAGGLGKVAEAIAAFDMTGFIEEIQRGAASLDSFFDRLGNAQIFKDFNKRFGLLTDENLAAYGMTRPPSAGPEKVAVAGGKTGSVASPIDRRIDEAFGTVAKPTVSLKDFATPDGKKGKSAKERADEYERLSKRISETTAEMVAETEAQRQLNPLVDDYGYAAEKARMERELLNAAEEAGKKITPALRAEIALLSEQYALAGVESAKLAEEQDRLRESMEDMQQLGKDVLGGFIQDMMNGQSAAEALKNALSKVADKLIEIGLNSLFEGLFPTGASSGGNFLQALFGGFRESGGPVQSGKAYVVGEKRPELFVPSQSGTILPAVPEMPRMSARGGDQISLLFAPTLHMPNAQPGVGREVDDALRKFEREFTPRVVKSLREIRTKGLVT
ncbi:tape measure protein [Aminobacter sp. NyZ550]|uniref:tape measure protein n=1 Tax=Aminobacter sp. NyZ550 TaxID=2979870 RepID=UPI0022B234C3|nr:tape measure protein [Aminobacter sp. NyZ550]WAX93199.1 tape measure protein [Aminobacter sp. NyZ550]